MREPRRLRRVVLKEELQELTGNQCSALILGQFLFWTDRTQKVGQMLKEEYKSQGQTLFDSLEGAEIETMQRLKAGWIYKSAKQLREELMGSFGETTIARRLQELVGQGYLCRRRNPRHGWDRTWQYRVNLRKVMEDMKALGYALEGYPIIQAKGELL